MQFSIILIQGFEYYLHRSVKAMTRLNSNLVLATQ